MHKKHSLKTTIAMSLLGLGLVGLTAGVSNAAFTSVSTVTKNATASLTAAGSVAMNVSVKTLAGSGATDVAWSNVTLPSGWVNADDYLQLDSTITASNGGIRVITDNTHSTPAYTGVSTATAAGLVDNTNTANTLQVAWTIKDNVIGSTGPVTAKPYDAINDGAGQPNQFQWLFITDAVDGMAQGAPYRTAVNSNGIHFGGGDTEFGAAVTPNYVYLEANFATAVTPRTYSTSKLIVEAFTQ